jgi:hypothetical protein
MAVCQGQSVSKAAKSSISSHHPRPEIEAIWLRIPVCLTHQLYKKPHKEVVSRTLRIRKIGRGRFLRAGSIVRAGSARSDTIQDCEDHGGS